MEDSPKEYNKQGGSFIAPTKVMDDKDNYQRNNI